MTEPRIVSIDLTHLVEAALHGTASAAPAESTTSTDDRIGADPAR